VGGEEYVKKILAGFEKNHEAHVAEYGAHNEMRLTGKHETASIGKFTYGVATTGRATWKTAVRPRTRIRTVSPAES
jgi:glutamine synthetase